MGCTVCHSKGIPSLVQDVLDNIPPMTIPLNTTRTNVYDAKEGRVRGFLFGASPGRGPQVAKAEFEHKMLLVVLHALATTSPIHTYSTIQFNHLQVGNHMPLHTDGRNSGRSFTMSFGDLEGQYDEVSTYQRWVEVRLGQIHGVTRITRGDCYSVVHFTPEKLHSRMSVESLDTLRQQGFPLSPTEFGLIANLGVEAHERKHSSYDRCFQGVISNLSRTFLKRRCCGCARH
eukprot:876609-Amphidinium_carterae.1